MEYLVIVLFVVAIFVANLVVSRALRRRRQAHGDSAGTGEAVRESGQQQQRAAKPQKPPRNAVPAKSAPAPRTSAAAAREANARLDAVQHQQVYAAIAQGHPIMAVKLYAQFTGVGVRAAGAAIENLATHPQPFQPPRPAGQAQAQAPQSGPVTTPGPESGPTEKASGPERAATAEPAKQDGPAATAGPAKQENQQAKQQENKQDSQDGSGQAGPETDGTPSSAAATPSSAAATPEEDEISKWVKNMRPEDF